MLLSDAFQLFLDDKYVYAAADTVRYYKDSLSGFISWLHDRGIDDVLQLDQDLLKQYAVYLRDVRKIKNTSIHTYFRGIKNFSLFCIDHHFCEYFNYKIRLPRPDPDLVLPLSSAEVNQIFNYIKDNTSYRNYDSYN
ncbi:MAG: phage integrase SAM-like domain-containing protein, partial [Prevotella sp.]|nr:phage integrase SAM-like domain-containing protein [Prevotella sp.]